MAFAFAETFARFVGLGAPVGGAFGAAALEAAAFSVSFPALACALGKGKRYMVTRVCSELSQFLFHWKFTFAIWLQ